MHKIAYFAAVTISALGIFACSQTVEAPSQSEEDATAYSSSSKNKNQDNSSKDNQTKKSSSSKSSDWDDDDDFDDNDGFVIDTAQITRSALQFTGETMDCDFSLDDSVWTIEQVVPNSTSISYITFNKKAMEIKMDVEAKNDPDKTCDESLRVWTFTLALVGGKDVDGSCTEDGFVAKATIVDTTRTVKDKEDVYKAICN